MRIPGTRDAHLSYCLNVHPGSTLAEAETAIFERAKGTFAELSRLTGAAGPFGLGLWLSAEAARELCQVGRLKDLARRLRQAGLYVFTLNGFPYGRFHGTRVKEKVYQPDWADDLRCHYTAILVHILAQLLPEGVDGTISTLPVTFRPWADEARLEAATENLADLAAFLHELEAASGKTIALALEPEPGCCLEKTDDVLRFFADRLLPRGVEVLCEEQLVDEDEAVEIVRRHVGVCLDTVHTGVMGEDPVEAIQRLAAAGIRVCKIQFGAALRVDVGEGGPPAALNGFRDEVYLHQVMVRGGQGERFYTDLPEPLAEDPPPRGEWRVHFHVPLAWDGEGDIHTTRGQVDEALLRAALDAGVRHFESEIYTLDVFPGARGTVEAIMAQDMAWLLERFGAVARNA